MLGVNKIKRELHIQQNYLLKNRGELKTSLDKQKYRICC